MNAVIACHACDLIHRIKPLQAQGAAYFIRFGDSLYDRMSDSEDRSWDSEDRSWKFR
jgi:hypothetical protein